MQQFRGSWQRPHRSARAGANRVPSPRSGKNRGQAPIHASNTLLCLTISTLAGACPSPPWCLSPSPVSRLCTGVGPTQLTSGRQDDKLLDMQTNVSELLRNFPKIRRAALAGETVLIRTREGNLVLTAEKPAGQSLFGSLAATIDSRSMTEADSGADDADWTASL